MTTLADWRQHDTPEFRAAAGDAQARLDSLDLSPTYTPELAQADQELADRYDQLVLQPAQDEFDRRAAQREFESAWPEPGDGARIEWGEDIRYAAYRMDYDPDGRHWYLYNDPGDHGYTWAELVGEYAESMYRFSDVTVLGEATS